MTAITTAHGEYTEAYQRELHGADDIIPFALGLRMRASTAAGLAYGLVELDRETGRYRRVQSSPASEEAIISAAQERNVPPPLTTTWASRRPR